MALQAGPIYLIGTIDDITYYKMEGEYLARKKSSLDRKQFRTDPRFARSRQSAKKFGEASTLASTIYWQLPKEQRGKGVVNQLTKQVGQLLKEGKTVEEIRQHVLQQHQPTIPKEIRKQQPKDMGEHPLRTSDWKVTAKGRLIAPMLEAMPSMKYSIASMVPTAGPWLRKINAAET